MTKMAKLTKIPKFAKLVKITKLLKMAKQKKLQKYFLKIWSEIVHQKLSHFKPYTITWIGTHGDSTGLGLMIYASPISWSGLTPAHAINRIISSFGPSMAKSMTRVGDVHLRYFRVTCQPILARRENGRKIYALMRTALFAKSMKMMSSRSVITDGLYWTMEMVKNHAQNITTHYGPGQKRASSVKIKEQGKSFQV